MRNRIFIFIILLFSISLSANEIEWEKVEGADFYEIEVINSLGEKVKKITTKETKLDLEIETIGKYRYRIGSADNNKRISWTNWIDFRVQKNSDKAKEKIILEWELQRLAEIYRIQVSNDSGHIVYEEKLNSNKTYLSLGIGKYKYRVASVNELGKEVWSDWESFEVKLKTWEVPNALEQANMGELSDKIDNNWIPVGCGVTLLSALHYFRGGGNLTETIRSGEFMRIRFCFLLYSLLIMKITKRIKRQRENTIQR
ncbi:MAG: hypothetical protein IPG24_13665 [Leptospiraceae bacterium]|nr:hypothetical protein [Leptospiraceae bacterium]